MRVVKFIIFSINIQSWNMISVLIFQQNFQKKLFKKKL